MRRFAVTSLSLLTIASLELGCDSRLEGELATRTGALSTVEPRVYDGARYSVQTDDGGARYVVVAPDGARFVVGGAGAEVVEADGARFVVVTADGARFVVDAKFVEVNPPQPDHEARFSGDARFAGVTADPPQPDYEARFAIEARDGAKYVVDAASDGAKYVVEAPEGARFVSAATAADVAAAVQGF